MYILAQDEVPDTQSSVSSSSSQNIILQTTSGGHLSHYPTNVVDRTSSSSRKIEIKPGHVSIYPTGANHNDDDSPPASVASALDHKRRPSTSSTSPIIDLFDRHMTLVPPDMKSSSSPPSRLVKHVDDRATIYPLDGAKTSSSSGVVNEGGHVNRNDENEDFDSLYTRVTKKSTAGGKMGGADGWDKTVRFSDD